jgi:DNA-binding MarR family transcriptional regulator
MGEATRLPREDRARVITWLRLARVYQRLDRASAEFLRRWDLSVAQFDVLAQVGAHEGLTQQELADHLLVTKGNISQLLARMERRGLVRRTQEGRALMLSLTPEGKRVRDIVVPAQEALIAAHLAPLDMAELRAVSATLRRLDRVPSGE